MSMTSVKFFFVEAFLVKKVYSIVDEIILVDKNNVTEKIFVNNFLLTRAFSSATACEQLQLHPKLRHTIFIICLKKKEKP